jgi:hypothetical protein
MATTAPVFNSDAPPLLKEVSLSTIYDNPEVAEQPTEYECLLAINLWHRLNSTGGQPMMVEGDPMVA